MSRSKWGSLVVVMIGCLLAGSMGTTSCLAAGSRSKVNRQDPNQGPPQPLAQDEYKSSGDPDANIMSLVKEKIETLRQREEGIRKAFTAGKQTQHDVDHVGLQVLNAELEVLDKPTLRIATLEKIVAIHVRHEKEAEQDISKVKANDVSGFISAHGKYTSAKIGRIDAQLRLERERSALQKEVGGSDSKAPSSDSSKSK